MPGHEAAGRWCHVPVAWGQPCCGYRGSLLRGTGGVFPAPSQGVCPKCLGAELCSMLLGPAVLAGPLKEPVSRLVAHPLNALCYFPLCCRDDGPNLGRCTPGAGISGICIVEMCCLGRSKRLLPASAGHEFCHWLQRAGAESMVLGPYGSNSRQADTIPTFCSMIRQNSGIWQHILPVPTPLLLPLPGCIRQGGVWGTSSKPELLRPDCINRHLEGVRGGRQGSLHLQEPERLLCTGGHEKETGSTERG